MKTKIKKIILPLFIILSSCLFVIAGYGYSCSANSRSGASWITANDVDSLAIGEYTYKIGVSNDEYDTSYAALSLTTDDGRNVSLAQARAEGYIKSSVFYCGRASGAAWSGSFLNYGGSPNNDSMSCSIQSGSKSTGVGWSITTNPGYTFKQVYISQWGGDSSEHAYANVEYSYVPAYWIYYITNGGAPIPAKTVVKMPNSLPTPIYTGYDFAGWFLDDSFTRSSSQIPAGTKFTEDLTLYAKWIEKEYKVNYFPNGADVTGTQPNVTRMYSEGLTLPSAANVNYVRYGYDFKGWSTDPNAAVSDAIVRINPYTAKDLNLYAVWEEKSATLILDPNNGDLKTSKTGITSENKLRYTQAFTLPGQSPNTPYYMGHSFLGWDPRPDAISPAYSAGTVFKEANVIPEDEILYAIWKLDTYNITYDTTCSPYNENNPKTYNVEQNKSLYDISDRDGWTFEGYFLDNEFKTKEYHSIESYSLEGDKLFYCKWKDIVKPFSSNLTYSPEKYITGTQLNYTNQDVIVSIDVGDVASGLGKVYVVKQNGDSFNIIKDLTNQITVGAHAGHVSYTATQRWMPTSGYYFLIQDVAGNKAISEPIAPEHIDKIEPEFPAVAEDQATTIVGENTLDVRATDDWSGMDYWEYNATYKNSFNEDTETGWVKVYAASDPLNIVGSIGIPTSSHFSSKLRACDRAGNCTAEITGPSSNFIQQYSADSQLITFDYIFALWDSSYPGQVPSDSTAYTFIHNLEPQSASNVTVKAFIDFIAKEREKGSSYKSALDAFFDTYNYIQRND